MKAQTVHKRLRYASVNGRNTRCSGARSPPRLLLLPVGLVSIRLRVAATVRLRRLVGSGLLRVVPKRDPVCANVWALDALVTRAGLSEAHDGTPPVTALGFCIPESTLVRLVMRVAAAGAAADGEEPEEGRDDREGSGDPGDGERASADRDLDVVWVEKGVQRAGQCGEEDRGCEGGEEGEDCGNL